MLLIALPTARSKAGWSLKRVSLKRCFIVRKCLDVEGIAKPLLLMALTRCMKLHHVGMAMVVESGILDIIDGILDDVPLTSSTMSSGGSYNGSNEVEMNGANRQYAI